MVMGYLRGAISRGDRGRGHSDSGRPGTCSRSGAEVGRSARRKRIIHRDLKPANLFLTVQDRGRSTVRQVLRQACRDGADARLQLTQTPQRSKDHCICLLSK
jgi:serine/threonine protein kinase